MPLTGAPVTLGLDGRVEDLSRWLALAGLDGGGRGSFRLDLSPDGPRQAGRLEATIEDARLDLSPEQSLTIEELIAGIRDIEKTERRSQRKQKREEKK